MGSSYSSSAVIQGTVAPGYETVRDMFHYNVVTGRDRQTQLCVYVKGEKVVDLWGSAEGDTTYTGDSLQCVFSSSKAVTAVAMAQAAERGVFQYHQPVAKYWPQFGQNSKAEIRMEDLLRHEAGIPHLDTSLRLEDLYPDSLHTGHVAQILVRQTPRLHPHTPREYHPLTAGWVCNEVFRRLSPGGVTLGSWIRSELSAPLKADVFLGSLEDTERSRIHNITALSRSQALFHSLLPNFLGSQVDYNIIIFRKLLRSFEKRFLGEEGTPHIPDCVGMDASIIDGSDQSQSLFNLMKWRESECPHGNVHASGRGLAKVAAAMAEGGSIGGVQVLSPMGWKLLHGAPIVREDASMNGCRTEFTQGGVNVFTDYPDDKIGERILKSGRSGFVGWMGFGGSVIMWHPGHRIGFGYTCTLLTWWDMANTKARKLQKEVVRCATALETESPSGLSPALGIHTWNEDEVLRESEPAPAA